MDVKSIKLEGGKILDLVLWDIVNDYTIKIMIFQFFFSNINRYNGLGYYEYNIYYYLDSIFNIIVISQTQINCLPIANRKLDD